jgi:hypothetical protein
MVSSNHAWPTVRARRMDVPLQISTAFAAVSRISMNYLAAFRKAATLQIKKVSSSESILSVTDLGSGLTLRHFPMRAIQC